MDLILSYYSICEPIQSTLAGELEICLVSLVDNEITFTRQMSSFSGPVQTLSLALWGDISGPRLFQKSEVYHQTYI